MKAQPGNAGKGTMACPIMEPGACPVFMPTREEFEIPFGEYVSKVRAHAACQHAGGHAPVLMCPTRIIMLRGMMDGAAQRAGRQAGGSTRRRSCACARRPWLGDA